MGTSDMSESIDKNINMDEYLVMDTTYNELNENIPSNAEEDLEVSKENAEKTVPEVDPAILPVANPAKLNSDKRQNPLATERSDSEVDPAVLPEEEAAKNDAAQNPLAKGDGAGVEIKLEDMSDDDEVQYVKTIHKDVVQETIDLDAIVDNDVAFVRQTVPKRTQQGWPKDTAAVQRIMSFRTAIFTNVIEMLSRGLEYQWIDYPLRGAARDFVNKTLCKINKGRIFYTDNDEQREYLGYIMEYMWNSDFYLDYAIKNYGFTIFKNYTKKMPKWPVRKVPKKQVVSVVKCEPQPPTNCSSSDMTNYNNVRIKVERV